MAKKEVEKSSGKKYNFWMIASVILVAIILISLVYNSVTTVTPKKAGEILTEFGQSQGVSLQVTEVKKSGSLYEITATIEGQTGTFYLTKDGKYFTSSLIPLESSTDSETTQTTTTNSQYTDEQNAEIQEFAQCLADKGFEVFAADWCPHCEALMETFGGRENVAPFWVVCQDVNRQPTENADRCFNEEGVTGFPTLKLNSQELNIARTFDAIASATGCPTPNL